MEYANGTLTKVYVRVNGGPFEFGDQLILGTPSNQLTIVTPVEGDPPDMGYGVVIYMDFHSELVDEPIQPGQIFECISSDPTDVSSFTKIWYEGE